MPAAACQRPRSPPFIEASGYAQHRPETTLLYRLVERDKENAWLATQGAEGPLDDLIGHSITYRIAVGPRAGQKLFTRVLNTGSDQRDIDQSFAFFRNLSLASGTL